MSKSDDDLSQEERLTSLEKLKLEVLALKRASAWYRPLLDAVPFVTALVTVVGLWAGAYKYFADKREARLAQNVSELKTDVDQILTFPTDDKISRARVTFALNDLERLTTDDAGKRANVTDIIEMTVENDLNFDKLRDVTFDAIVLSHWKDYSSRLSQKGGSPNIRNRYIEALRRLYATNPEYFSSIDYNDALGGFTASGSVDEAKYLEFLKLVSGYQRHLKFIGSAPERVSAVENFSEALHNPRLAAKLLSFSF